MFEHNDKDTKRFDFLLNVYRKRSRRKRRKMMRAVDQKMVSVVMKERVVAGKTGSQKRKLWIWTNPLQSMAPPIFVSLTKGKQASKFQINS